MELQLGVKSDPIEYRYSYAWLFDLMRRHAITHVQLGTVTEFFTVPDEYFTELRAMAAEYGVTVSSCFTAHRELGGFFTGNRFLEDATRRNQRRLIEAAALLGAKIAGSNAGAVYRDRMEYKNEGMRRYLDHMKEMMRVAAGEGLEALTLEPMSCPAEPPSTLDEIARMMEPLAEYHSAHPEATVPVYLCGDVSHGLADRTGRVIHGNMELFEGQLEYLAEFHFKNTDEIFNSTFGFSEEERRRGIVDAEEVCRLLYHEAARIPVHRLIGYLEIGGPKTGREYSDPLLGPMLEESLEYLSSVYVNS